mgnify:CR=1 FL=1
MGRCLSCYGEHEPDSDAVYVDFEGYRFHKPFHCTCCGRVICARQFAFGRACGACDVGACQSDSKVYDPGMAHPHPKWWEPFWATKGERLARYVAFVNSERLAKEMLA